MKTARHAERGTVQTESATLFLTTLRDRSEKFGLELKNCRTEFSEAAVHDLRVATRRLLASLGLARALDPHPRLQKVRRLMKNQIDELDGLRDCQVMLVEVAESLEEHPELAFIHEHLLGREKRLLRKARRQVKDFELPALRKLMKKIEAGLEEHLVGPDVGGELLGAVDNAYAIALQRYGQIDAAQPATIHRLRLAFKKFRYMLEIVHPALPDFPQGQLKHMHDYQSLMGEVQDAESFLGLLEEIAEDDPSSEIEPARGHFEGLRAKRLSTYLDDKGELLVFWRPAPDQPFPWQSQPKRRR